MFGELHAELTEIARIKFGEWIDSGHKDTIYELNQVLAG